MTDGLSHNLDNLPLNPAKPVFRKPLALETWPNVGDESGLVYEQAPGLSLPQSALWLSMVEWVGCLWLWWVWQKPQPEGRACVQILYTQII